MSEKKSKLSQMFSNMKYSFANKRAAKKEDNKIKKFKRDKWLKSFFNKEERQKRKKNKE